MRKGRRRREMGRERENSAKDRASSLSLFLLLPLSSSLLFPSLLFSSLLSSLFSLLSSLFSLLSSLSLLASLPSLLFSTSISIISDLSGRGAHVRRRRCNTKRKKKRLKVPTFYLSFSCSSFFLFSLSFS